LIGDLALYAEHSENYSYQYDLGEMWFEMTGLPMVFGLFARQKNLTSEKIAQVDQLIRDCHYSVKKSSENMDLLVETAHGLTKLPEDKLKEYYACLEYNFSHRHQSGLSLFQEMTAKMKI
jgi:chorismate dehydratase